MNSTIKPFEGTCYNPSKIPEMSSVVCPPYDVIDHKQLALLRKKSPYNFSNVLLADRGDYKALGGKFRAWIKDEVFVDDKKQCLYLYDQKYCWEGKVYCRVGVLSLLRMDRKNSIFPHEHTLSKPKQDRERMIEETKTNLSPIFVIVPKPLAALHKIYDNYRRQKPLFEFKDLDGNDNFVWKIDDAKVIKKICSILDKSPLVIADGHHRFEVSYNYYKKNKGKYKDLNYVLAYVADAQKGLLILPTHRIVEINDRAEVFFKKLETYFYIREIKEDVLRNRLSKKGNFSIGIYRDRKFYFLKLKNPLVLDKLFGKSVYKKIDTYLLHHFVFSLFRVENITYTHNFQEAVKMARTKKIAFFVRPASLNDVFETANQGYRLPQKSTYFYPKIVSGVVIRRFKKDR